MKQVASIDAKYLKMSRKLSDLEQKLLRYFLACARDSSPSAFFQNGDPDATELTIKLSELIPAYCTYKLHLDEVLANLLCVTVYYDNGKDFCVFAIIEAGYVGSDHCGIVIAPHALGFLNQFILRALEAPEAMCTC